MTELLAFLLATLAMGALVDRGLFGAPACSPIERFGRTLMFGLGLLGALSLALDVAGLTVNAANLGLVCGVVAVPLLWGCTRTPRVRFERPEREVEPLERGLLILLAVITIATVVVFVRSGWIRPTYQFDAITRWMFKAKVLVVEGTLRGDISFAPEFWYTHQQYPPLVSHVAAIPSNLLKLWKADWAFDDRVASAVFPLYAVALVCLVYGAVARRSSRLLGAFAAFWVSTLPLIAYLPGPPPGSGASSALADIPLSMFATGAAIAAADLLDDRRRRAALEVGLLLGLGALTKNEGLPMVVAFGLALVLCLRTARFRRTAGIVALAGGLYLVLWGVIALQIPALDENYWGQISGSAISHGLSRIPGIVWAFFSGMLDFRQWNVTWLAIGIFIALGWKRLERPALRLLLLVVVFQILAYGFAYMVSGWTSPRAVMVLNNTDATDPLQVLFTLTMGRLLLHVAPVAIILATLAAPLRFRSSG